MCIHKFEMPCHYLLSMTTFRPLNCTLFALDILRVHYHLSLISFSWFWDGLLRKYKPNVSLMATGDVVNTWYFLWPGLSGPNQMKSQSNDLTSRDWAEKYDLQNWRSRDSVRSIQSGPKNLARSKLCVGVISLVMCEKQYMDFRCFDYHFWVICLLCIWSNFLIFKLHKQVLGRRLLAFWKSFCNITLDYCFWLFFRTSWSCR